MGELVGKVKMNYDYYPGEDLYSDGAVEDELLDIVTNHSEDDFNEIIAQRKSWPILYHLSTIRQNIIEWYPFTKNDKVLEIGSGCGAITGALSRKAASVTCVELSKKRSLINANRNRSCDNVDIMVGNFQDIEPNLPCDYDYITLIGVLEYGASYINSDDSYNEFIAIIKKHLKPSGKLIVAIENKYGLKYWAGCKEDHVSRYYEGIEGYTHTKGVKTFSKKGLCKLFENNHMKVEEMYYPYPDYKLPTQIYSDGYLPKVGELTINFLNLDNERLVTFDEAKVYDSLIEDGLFEEFSNSFLVVAGKED